MKKTSMSLFAFAMLVAISAASAAPSPWDGCSFQNFKVAWETYENIEPPFDTYDYCASFKVTGTLKGRLISCGMGADWVPSEEVFEEDDTPAFAAKWFDTFETEGGTISGTELGWVDGQNFLQASMYIIKGGTGKYQGATGYFTFSPDWPSKGTTGFQGSGFVCPAK